MLKKVLIAGLLALLSTGCTQLSTVRNEEVNYGLNKILMLNDEVLVYTKGTAVMLYEFEEEFSTVFYQLKNIDAQFKIDHESEQFLIYEYDNDTSGKFITGYFDESSGALKLSEQMYTNQELVDSYWEVSTVSNSGDKIAFTSEFGLGTHLQVKNSEEEVLGKIDYASSFSSPLWSPTDKFLAYTTESASGDESLSIFDIEESNYGTENYDEKSDGYSFNTNSVSILEKIPQLNASPRPEVKVEIVKWIDEDTLLFEVNTQVWKNFSESTFWTYNAETDSLNEFGRISLEKEEIIQDSIISTNLEKLAFIKTYSDKKLSPQDKTAIKQDLWVSNADGTDAKMIYKNY